MRGPKMQIGRETNVLALTHRSKSKNDARVGHDRRSNQGRVVPAEHPGGRNGDTTRYAHDTPDALPGGDADQLDQRGEEEKLAHGHRETRRDKHLVGSHIIGTRAHETSRSLEDALRSKMILSCS